MRFVLTGASGFLGKALISFLENDHEIAVLQRDGSTADQNPSGSITIIPYRDIKEQELARQLKNWAPDVFMHMGWRGVHGKERNEASQFTDNISLTLNTISLAANAGCSQWIGAGSQAEYGIANKLLSEDNPCKPVNAYGKAKYATSVAAMGMCEIIGIKGSWCRIFSLYGPNDNKNNFIPYIINSIANSVVAKTTACEQMWDYLYIDDAVKALIAIADKQASGIFNIGSGKVVQLKEVVLSIQHIMGSDDFVEMGSIPYPVNPLMHLQADIRKIIIETGWIPETDLQQGILKTIDYNTVGLRK